MKELKPPVANHSHGETDGCSAVEELVDPASCPELGECGLDVDFTGLGHESMVLERGAQPKGLSARSAGAKDPCPHLQRSASMVVSSKR